MSEIIKQDRRIAKTQNALWSALLTLLQDHSWDEITIKLLCDTANVARSSFYVHFDSKSSLLDFGFTGTTLLLQEMIESSEPDRGDFVVFSWLVDHIAENVKFYKTVARSASNQIIFTRFWATCKNVLEHELSHRQRSNSTSATAFVIGGIFALIEQWINSRCVLSQGELKRELRHYANKVLAD